jgi:formylglycine-generating enzyme required for sulfatase activity
VYVDGKKIGETPLSYRDLPPSSYAYEFRLKGYKSASVRGEINAGETARAHGVMEQIRGPESGQAWTVPELGLVLQPIAAGTFLMESEQGASEEKPVTRVTITKPYWLGATEVTQSQYEAVMGNNPSDFRGANLPVEQVTWEEAMEFGRKVTQRERAAGRLPSGYVYTLPSEAQWEYGCRAGTTGDYAGDLNTMGWYNENSGGTTHAVGTKRANGWGLSDMHGNVFEWCADWYGAYLGGSVSDPKGAPAGTFRVLRGGGWSHDAAYCRSAYRYWCGPGFRNNYIGFRLALSSAP